MLVIIAASPQRNTPEGLSEHEKEGLKGLTCLKFKLHQAIIKLSQPINGGLVISLF